MSKAAEASLSAESRSFASGMHLTDVVSGALSMSSMSRALIGESGGVAERGRLATGLDAAGFRVCAKRGRCGGS